MARAPQVFYDDGHHTKDDGGLPGLFQRTPVLNLRKLPQA
jgi:hypothetical protein